MSQSICTQYLEISTILRLSGEGLTISAILLFLFQRWDDASDLFPYGMILGEALMLTGLGFVTSRWLKEQKSARVFILGCRNKLFHELTAMLRRFDHLGILNAGNDP